MTRIATLLALLLLALVGCDKPEEILPIPSRSNGSAPPVPPQEQVENSRPVVNADAEVFLPGQFKDMPYRILLPRNYDSAKTYPLHIFLHGIGERGADNEKHLSAGASHFQADSIREKYPAFIVYPQCPATGYWFNSDITQTLKALIDNLLATYPVDQSQVSLGGFSMGAYGTFAMVARYPGLFRAAVAISGDGDEDKATLMAKPAWQLFAGERDDIVPSSKTEKMAKALTSAGASVSFKLYPGADHGATCQHAFAEPDFFAKLFRNDKR